MSTLYIDRKGLGCKLENGALVFYENGERCGTVPTAPLDASNFQNGTVFLSSWNGGYWLLPLASFQEKFWLQNSVVA